MRCYFDETWQTLQGGQRVGVIFGLILKKELLLRLDNFLYKVRKKYYGKVQAKDKKSELKGKQLFSNITFKIERENPGVMPNNHCIAMEVISWCKALPASIAPKVFASIVYGTDPHLKCLDPKRLDLPFMDLCIKISEAASEMERNGSVTLVFDERYGVQKGIAISIYNFIRGVGVNNINPYPLFAVSNVDPGVQLADIFAYIVGKRATKDQRFIVWYKRISSLQWKGEVAGKKRWGFQRYETRANGSYKIRRTW
ncbi:DUF3800 domain-containing protein [Thermodesulfobacteriota bacterium]